MHALNFYWLVMATMIVAVSSVVLIAASYKRIFVLSLLFMGLLFQAGGYLALFDFMEGGAYFSGILYHICSAIYISCVLCIYPHHRGLRSELLLEWWPVAVIALAGSLISERDFCSLICSAVLVLQNKRGLYLSYSSLRPGGGFGQYLVLAGLVVNVLVVVINGVFVFRRETDNAIMLGGLESILIFVFSLLAIVFVVVGFVVSSIERSELDAVRLSCVDSLTGLWNRKKTSEVALSEIVRFKRYGSPLSMILADIDNFKSVNDVYGHALGDAVLKEFSFRAQSCVRDTDVLGRWGGEEFLVILPFSEEHSAEQVAERIRKAVSESPLCGVNVTVSLGVAEFAPQDSFSDWFQRADLAIYSAKRNGRNRVEVFVEPSVRSATAA